jgi:hypothetical protein
LTRSPLTFVSVAFEAEVPLLVLQARSMARFLPSADVGAVIVVDNSGFGMSRSVRRGLDQAYGVLADRVRVVRPRQVVRVPVTTGWRSQQILKLAVSHQIEAAHYVVLDAKNHFVATPEPTFFVADDGRPAANTYSYREHPHRSSLEHVLTYLGLDPAAYLDSFTATVTPFTFETARVRAMMADIEQRSGRRFADEFVSQELTEFFLYSGWLVRSGLRLDEVFDVRQSFCPTVWPGKANRDGVAAAVSQSERDGSPLFAVHRSALARLDADAVAPLVDYWCRVGLFPDRRQGIEFVRRFQRRYARVNVVRKLRETPYRLRPAAHGAGGRR